MNEGGWLGYLGGITAAVTLGGAIVVLMLRGWLAGRYATTEQVDELEERVGAVESSTRDMLRRGDLREVERRIGTVETGVSGVRGQLQGVTETLKSIDHTVGLLLAEGLKKGTEG